MQTSFFVQGLPSLQTVLFATGVPVPQTPVVQVSPVSHEFALSHADPLARFWLRHAPLPLHSSDVQVLPSLGQRGGLGGSSNWTTPAFTLTRVPHTDPVHVPR